MGDPMMGLFSRSDALARLATTPLGGRRPAGGLARVAPGYLSTVRTQGNAPLLTDPCFLIREAVRRGYAICRGVGFWLPESRSGSAEGVAAVILRPWLHYRPVRAIDVREALRIGRFHLWGIEDGFDGVMPAWLADRRCKWVRYQGEYDRGYEYGAAVATLAAGRWPAGGR
jgi:hypothetical protein